MPIHVSKSYRAITRKEIAQSLLTKEIIRGCFSNKLAQCALHITSSANTCQKSGIEIQMKGKHYRHALPATPGSTADWPAKLAPSPSPRMGREIPNKSRIQIPARQWTKDVQRPISWTRTLTSHDKRGRWTETGEIELFTSTDGCHRHASEIGSARVTSAALHISLPSEATAGHLVYGRRPSLQSHTQMD